jgi:hypothetical protein
MYVISPTYEVFYPPLLQYSMHPYRKSKHVLAVPGCCRAGTEPGFREWATLQLMRADNLTIGSPQTQRAEREPYDKISDPIS